MKFILTHLVAIATLFVLLACLAWSQLKQDHRKQSHRSIRRAGVRAFTRLERFALLFVVPMSLLSTWCHRMVGDNRIVLANYIAQPGGDEDSKLADAAITRRSLVKIGSDENHIALCGVGDIPLGATRDGSCTAASILVSFAQFGIYSRELEGFASGAIAAGDLLVAGANGAVRTLPVTTGTYYIIGRAKMAAADTTPVVYIPTFPVQRVVA